MNVLPFDIAIFGGGEGNVRAVPQILNPLNQWEKQIQNLSILPGTDLFTKVKIYL